MKLYLAGPMTGYPHFNIPAFDMYATLLREEGFSVVSPAELDDPADRAAAFASPDGSEVHYTTGKTWGDFLARDVKLLADDGIEGVAVLPGWERSKGARLETYVAMLAGLPIYEVGRLLFGHLDPIAPIKLYRAWTGADVYLHAQYGHVRRVH